MVDRICIEPIGYVQGGRSDAIDDEWGLIRSKIQLDPDKFSPEAFAGLGEFSHIEVIFFFDRVPDQKIELGARRPRGRADWPLVGIFAQRGKNRPNRLGLCTCKVVSAEGLIVEVEGLDAIDGTPVLDIKPVMRGFLPRGDVREPVWAEEIMADYW